MTEKEIGELIFDLILGVIAGATSGFCIDVMLYMAGLWPQYNYTLAPLVFFGIIVSFSILGLWINYQGFKYKMRERRKKKRERRNYRFI